MSNRTNAATGRGRPTWPLFLLLAAALGLSPAAAPEAAAQLAAPAPPPLPDLLPAPPGLTVGATPIPWGQTATISPGEASETKGGRCRFRYRYDTANAGQAAAGAATNRIRLDAPAGPELAKDALPGLAAGAQHTSSGHLWLKGGTWTLYVGVDNDFVVAESDEQNNMKRVRVRVDGRCK